MRILLTAVVSLGLTFAAGAGELIFPKGLVLKAEPLPAGAGQIQIQAAVAQTIQLEVQRPQLLVPLDAAHAAKLQQVLRAWVGKSIDLNKAQKRVSQRDQRTSFTEDVTTHTPRLPTERLDLRSLGLTHIEPVKELKLLPRAIELKTPMPPNGPAAAGPLGPRAPFILRPIPAAGAHMVLYREGPSHFLFHRMIEARAQRPIPDGEAMTLAHGFVQGNALFQPTASDTLGATEVIQRRANEDGGGPGAGNDYLLQQDVVMQRLYQGKPVVNSKLVVGFHPDTRDIVLLRHQNWTPTRDAAIRRLQPAELKAAGADTAVALTNRIRARVFQTSGQAFLRADVVKAVPAWFQTQAGLLPILVFETQVQVATPTGPLMEPYLEAINLAGADDALYADQNFSPLQQPGAAQ